MSYIKLCFLSILFIINNLFLFGQSKILDNGSIIEKQPPINIDYLGSCDSLSTTYSGITNSSTFPYEGNMLSIKATSDIIIQSFEGNFSSSGTVKIYYRSGMYMGFENSSTGWNFIDSVYVNSAGSNMASFIPIPINLEVDSGEVISFYITGIGDGILSPFSLGSMVGDTSSFNNDLIIYQGNAISYPFNSGYYPIMWNGTINYCSNINYCDEISTSYTGGVNSNDGIVFEIDAIKNTIVDYVETSVVDTGYVYIYYKLGSYIGNTTNPFAWTLIDSALVVSEGVGNLVKIPIDINLFIQAGQTYSLLITGNGIDNQAIYYANGTSIGSLAAEDNTLQIIEGEGFVAPWVGSSGVPRIFNGIIHYCNPNVDSAIVCYDHFTTNTANNSYAGIMFDVEALDQIIEIQYFETFLLGTGLSEVRIYYKNDTYLGYETTPAAWTLIDSINVTINTSGLNTIPISVNMQVQPNTRMGFFIFASQGVKYSNGQGITIPDTIFSNDQYMMVREGSGVAGIFNGAAYYPRVYNGIINYCVLQNFAETEAFQPGKDNIKIWPNPANNEFNISNTNLNDEIEMLEIINMEGKIVKTEIGQNNYYSTIDVSDINEGMYFIKVYTNTSVHNSKLIISKKSN